MAGALDELPSDRWKRHRCRGSGWCEWPEVSSVLGRRQLARLGRMTEISTGQRFGKLDQLPDEPSQQRLEGGVRRGRSLPYQFPDIGELHPRKQGQRET